MREIVRGVLLALAFPAAATASGPVGAPAELRVARAADTWPHPSAHTEQWELLAIHPRTRRTVMVRLRRAPDLEGVQVLVDPPVGTPVLADHAQTFQRARGARVRFSGPDGTTTIDRRGGRFRITLAGPAVRGRLTLRRARPGPFARGWRIMQAFVRNPVPMGLAWNVPVATSAVRGTLRIGGQALRMNGWRASLEHVWGSLQLPNLGWEHWDAYTVHDGRGGAWVATGLNRIDTVTGPGARDAQYLGVLARVTPRGVRVCRPRVHRRDWRAVGFGEPFSRRVHARCGGMRVSLAGTGEVPSLPSDYDTGPYEARDRATANGRGFGFGRHRGHRQR